jgi:hypothetical protein
MATALLLIEPTTAEAKTTKSYPHPFACAKCGQFLFAYH